MLRGNRKGKCKNQYASISDYQVEILDIKASTKYLGRVFGFSDTMGIEIQNRISLGWKKLADDNAWEQTMQCLSEIL